MTEQEIYEALSARLVDNAPPMKLVPPNQDDVPVKPYLTLDVVPTRRENKSLNGGIEMAMGFCQITLVSETNEDESQVLAMAQQIAGAFPHRLRVTPELLLVDPPMIQNGYRDGPDWRTPIRINYLAHRQQ